MKKSNLLIFTVLIVGFISTMLNSEMISYSENWGDNGFNLTRENSSGIEIVFSIENFNIENKLIDGREMKSILLPGTILPNDEGAPDLPGLSRMIAVPNGANASFKIISSRTEIFSNIEIAPAPQIPLDTDKGPLVYMKNESLYSRNANYPENPVLISQPQKLRGVDIVMLGITPFQYNPVTKELIVYKDLKIEVNFQGGSGYFGEDRLRSRWWDASIKKILMNNRSLPEIEYNTTSNSRTDDYEYIIITPDDPTFIAWADSIRNFRTQQGIRTGVVTTTEIGGNTVSAIETYVDNAYNNWDVPPSAVLLLADYGTGTSGITSHFYSHPASYPDYASDNRFADVDGDDLPEIAFARITANDASQLEVMITKFLDYERNPPTNPDFYDHPITALGWQTERWFQICSEVVGGYFRNVHSKNPVRINAVYSGNPTSDAWSTATNTSTVLSYFGPSGLDYIPATPQELGGFSGGTAADVVNAINDGSFLLQHRDHGSYSGWGEPDFQSSNINSLTNINNELPFIFSINCQTGAFHNASESFTEKFHRHTYNSQNSGALGLIAATEVSYSFVNDTYVWGVYDNMYPDFMPAEETEFPVFYMMPAFANAAGKHFLYQSSWPYNSGDKQVTYRLFHHHGDAFLNLYSEVPQNLTVAHNDVLLSGVDFFEVTADDGALIGLTVNGEIIGVGEGTGSPVSISIPAQVPGETMIVTITKQNYYRYSGSVEIIPPEGGYVIFDAYTINDPLGNNNGVADYNETITLDMTLENVGLNNATDVVATISETDAYVTITDNTQNYGTILSESTSTQNNAFSMNIADDVPDQHTVSFALEVTGTSSRDTWNSSFQITINAPEITISNMIIDDSNENNNGRLDPGETVDLIIPTNNDGHSNSPAAVGVLSCLDAEITINSSNSFNFGVINSSSTENATFNITVSAGAEIGTLVSFDYEVTAGNYGAEETFNRSIGLILEDFETGNFSAFPWEFGGDADWSIVTVSPYEGVYCAKSGTITHSQTSELILNAEINAAGDVSFYRKVSSESSYDYLEFYIDDILQERWSGTVAWSEVSYPVTVGEREFKWRYSKDSSVSTGSDCAWIDYIIFPSMGTVEPANISVNPLSLTLNLQSGETTDENLRISNTGGSNLNYSITQEDRSYGGPDSYGYSWKDSDEPDGPEYSWRDISGLGTLVSFTHNDYATDLMPIGFTFNYYGTDYTQFRISPNGWIGFGGDWTDYHNYELPRVDAPKPALFGFWDDLDPLQGGDVYYYGNPDSLIVWFDEVIHYPGTWNGTYDFQIIIYASGRILFQYRTVTGDIDTSTVGIQNETGTDGLQVSYNDTYLHNDLAILYYTDWLQISPTSGTVVPSAYDDITVSFDASGLPAGTYLKNIDVASNDPLEPNVIIPVTLNVGTTQPPATPENITIEIVGSNIYIGWDAVSGATSYTVYSDSDPYGTFLDNEWSGTATSWSESMSEEMKFYRVTASNGTLITGNQDKIRVHNRAAKADLKQ